MTTRGGGAIAIDVGGTFTDLVAVDGHSREPIHLKVASTPEDPAGGFVAALEALGERVDLESLAAELILHGTTVITNAIIEGRLARTALVTTAGFRDVLEIGRHWRPHLYDLAMKRPPAPIARPLRLEVDERVGADGAVVRPLSTDSVDAVLEALRSLDVESVAVVLLHAYANPAHEQELRRRLAPVARYVSTSSQVSREPREYERSATTALNAALMPLVDGYLARIESSLAQDGSSPRLYVSHSNGGAMSPSAAREAPVTLAQSGPVAGVMAAARLAVAHGRPNAVALDMGGTSTDVAVIEDGAPRLASQLKVGELPIRLPAVQIHSLGAGGGSIASVDEQGIVHVGPGSAGADPGPACYGRGNPEPTVTDCDVVLGRLPHDWPLGGFLALDVDAAWDVVRTRLAEPIGQSVEAAAEGVLEITAAAMEGAIRVLLRERGSDPRDFALIAFGGAGPLHAVELAGRLGIREVIVPAHPGTFSASGLLQNEIRHAFALSRPIRSDDEQAAGHLASAYEELERDAREEFAEYTELHQAPRAERRCDVRYLGQAYEVSVPLEADPTVDHALERLVSDFHAAHERAYAFANPDEACEIRTIRLFLNAEPGHVPDAANGRPPRTAGRRDHAAVVLGGAEVSCEVWERGSLGPDDVVPVPSIAVQEDATTFIPPGVRARVGADGALIVSDIPAT